MKTNEKLLIFVLLLVVNRLFTQNFQLAGISYSNYAKTRIKNSPTNQEVNFQELSFFMKLPIKFKNKKTVLMNNLRYSLIRPTLHNSPFSVNLVDKKNLHSISLSPTLIQNLSEKWIIVLALTPTLASDLNEKLSADDFLFQGTLLASVKLSDKLLLGGGLIYTTQLGDPRFLPALQLRYLKNKYFVNVMLPSFATYLYKVDNRGKFNLGFRLATNGGNFNVNRADFVGINGGSVNKIIYSRVNAGALANIQVTKGILLEVFGGISAARKYKFQTVSKALYSNNSENGGFLNFSLLLTPPSKAAEDSNNDN
jgi:hypothetical protein